MIISRTPFRISFFGGGTDYPVWYREHGGSVLATSINKYCYITCRYLPPFFKHKHRIVYSKMEHTKTISEIQHLSARETLNFMNIDRGVEIHHDGDLPARTGLGSSSAFTVGLLNTLYALKGKMVTMRQLALDAIHIEQDLIKENVGSQDQTSAAFGGFNKIEFGGEQQIQVSPITINSRKLQLLQDNLMLFFTGFSRTASEIAGEQIKQTPNKKNELNQMLEMVDDAVSILNRSDSDITDFGRLLHESWLIKRSLTDKISNQHIDNIYEEAINAGALGGKLLGAGGGGFVLFFVEPEFQSKVREKLRNLLYVPFKFESLGSQIIYYVPQNDF
ncbi:kinase [Patescibacteria group bacterium]|nr:kinase [Patescibacteria group bacterium]MBU0846463.1 kinase [Patescibacteria group bacterium]